MPPFLCIRFFFRVLLAQTMGFFEMQRSGCSVCHLRMNRVQSSFIKCIYRGSLNPAGTERSSAVGRNVIYSSSSHFNFFIALFFNLHWTKMLNLSFIFKKCRANCCIRINPYQSYQLLNISTSDWLLEWLFLRTRILTMKPNTKFFIETQTNFIFKIDASHFVKL